MEVKREKLRALSPLAEPGSPEHLRVRQLRARDLLRGDLDEAELTEHVEQSVLTTTLEKVLAWGASNSMFPMTFGLACCAMEMIAVVGSPRNDLARFGAEVFRFSPRQCDLMIVAGRVVMKMLPVLQRIWQQMLEPKWCISMGACASTGGVFDTYSVVQGIDRFIPVDVYVPGCPPRPEQLLRAIIELQDVIKKTGTMDGREFAKRTRPTGPAPLERSELVRLRDAVEEGAVRP